MVKIPSINGELRVWTQLLNATQIVKDVCLFVMGIYVPLENFSLIWRRHHYRWRASNLDLHVYSALICMGIEQWGFFLVYLTCCDRGHPFIFRMVISEDPWHSHLLPSVWQWKCHNLFVQLRTVTAGIRTPNLQHARRTLYPTAPPPWCLKDVVNMYLTGITSEYLETLERNLVVTWLKYCRYGVKLYPINQSINRGKPREIQELLNFGLQIIVRFLSEKNQRLANQPLKIEQRNMLYTILKVWHRHKMLNVLQSVREEIKNCGYLG